MGEYRYSLQEAFFEVPMSLSLSLQAAARERRGQPHVGPDFAERAGDRAVQRMKEGQGHGC